MNHAIGRGQYQLTVEFSFLKVDKQKFYTMTDLQKTSLHKSFFSSNLKGKLKVTVEKLQETQHVFILHEFAHISDVPFPLLKAMFYKASKYLEYLFLLIVPSISSENQPTHTHTL